MRQVMVVTGSLLRPSFSLPAIRQPLESTQATQKQSPLEDSSSSSELTSAAIAARKGLRPLLPPTHFPISPEKSNSADASSPEQSISEIDSDVEEEFFPTSGESLSFRPAERIKRRFRTARTQLHALESHFSAGSTRPNLSTRTQLSAEVNMTPRRIQVWFQNRRAKTKKGLIKSGSLPSPSSTPPRAAFSRRSDSKLYGRSRHQSSDVFDKNWRVVGHDIRYKESFSDDDYSPASPSRCPSPGLPSPTISPDSHTPRQHPPPPVQPRFNQRIQLPPPPTYSELFPRMVTNSPTSEMAPSRSYFSLYDVEFSPLSNWGNAEYFPVTNPEHHQLAPPDWQQLLAKFHTFAP